MLMRRRGFILVLLLALFAQLALSAPRLSLTSDEPSHIVAGLTYLATGDLWAPPLHGHPPLLNALNAALLMRQFGASLPKLPAYPGWGHDFLSYARALIPDLGPIERLAFVTRAPTMLLAVLLAALVCRWGAELFGGWAGVSALAVLAFDPNLLAHANLATTDLGVTLLGLAVLYGAWRASRAPEGRARWCWMLASGFFLGLTLASKGSGFLYAPAIVAVLIWPPHKPFAPLRLRALALEIFAISTVAFVTLWAVYGFQIGPLPGGDLPAPFPAHIGVWRIIFQDVQRVAFVNGARRVGGWWWYFFYTTAVKTPLPLLAVGVWAAATWLKRGPRYWLHTAPLLCFPALYWMSAIVSGMNIGHRHLLPTFPFLYLGVGLLASGVGSKGVGNKKSLAQNVATRPHTPYSILHIPLFLTSLILWLALDTLAVFPFHLAYFNPLAGGPENGYRHLVDSNVDWGQSFIALREYMAEARVDRVRLSYYTYVDPAAYGIDYEPLPPARDVAANALPPFAPQPGVYALSATPLQGIMVTPGDLYDWFRRREPAAQPGYGLLVYDVQPEDVAVDWVVQCAAPVAPLPAEAIAAGTGQTPRIATCDCTQAWLIPPGSGYHLLARDAEVMAQPFVAEHLAALELAYEQRESSAYPAFAFYRSGEAPAATTRAGYVAPSALAPAQVVDAAALTAPLAADGPLAFEGARFNPGPYRPGDVVELATFWRVTAIPELRGLSVMGHLLADEGALVANADGLGVGLDQWRVGDLIVQRHVIAIPSQAAAGRYWLQTGVYWLDTLERWQIAGAGDRILLGEIDVRP
ncbi:MAG: ArnT family glycosyltransferase [Anaerolineales bacterium]